MRGKSSVSGVSVPPKAKKRPRIHIRRGGRPPYAPTQEQRERVANFVAQGLTQKRIASLLGIAELTLAKRFAYELKNGYELLIAEAVGVQAKNLRSPDPYVRQRASEYTLSRRGGWSEKHLSENVNVNAHLTEANNPGLQEKMLKMMSEFEVVGQPKKSHLELLPPPIVPVREAYRQPTGSHPEDVRPLVVEKPAIDSTARRVEEKPRKLRPYELEEQRRNERSSSLMEELRGQVSGPDPARSPGGKFGGDL